MVYFPALFLSGFAEYTALHYFCPLIRARTRVPDASSPRGCTRTSPEFVVAFSFFNFNEILSFHYIFYNNNPNNLHFF